MTNRAPRQRTNVPTKTPDAPVAPSVAPKRPEPPDAKKNPLILVSPVGIEPTTY
jgi:hypothetical protein